MPFPILRTPFVVLSEIVSLLEPNEIVTASFCSKKLKNLLKRNFPRGKPLAWRLTMTDKNSYGEVDIETSEDGEHITVISAKHISVLEGHKLKLTNGYIRGNGTWAIDWVNNRQEKILYDFEWIETAKCNSDADKTVDYVLRNARASNYCSIEGSVSDNFKFDGELGPMSQLWIRSNGHWITLNNLINFDSIEITVRGSRLSVSDLNSFLRHWRAGGSSRLKWLHLNFEEHTFQEWFDEDLEVVETNEERVYRRVCFGFERVVHGGYSIQRMDGVKALIQCDLREFIMAVWA
ncbi:hypothetical protein B9Z55_015873 [Caenorhabditis nigoni]|uniref:F-box domain-containing protein n=1 Tax=Caenorhabditis nigoni TaxID=1611254 RepID=A0A2G5UC53_9PELO|nr:hypothetical protein B9Z55_015873 [Caenorhabditis nigoni]